MYAAIISERGLLSYAFFTSLPLGIQQGHFFTSHSDREADELMLETLYPKGEDGGLANEITLDEFAEKVQQGAKIVEFGIRS